MAYTIDDFPISTDTPQIEVNLPVGTHILELVVEDSAGLKSLPDTVVITVEKEDVPEAAITSIKPTSAQSGSSFNLTISGQGLAGASKVTFYRQLNVLKATIPTLPTITGPIVPINVVDTTMKGTISKKSDTSVLVNVAIAETALAGTRTFAITMEDGGVVSSKKLTFTVTKLSPTVTIPTITKPTLTIPTITKPTLTIPTITKPTLTIPTATLTKPTLTIPTATLTKPTLTIPTATLTKPTLTFPTATLTKPTTKPTLTFPTATLTKPTTKPTLTVPIPTLTKPTIPVFLGEGLALTSVKGVGAATEDKLRTAGIGTVSALASANAKDVAKALGFQDITRADALINEAKKLMG